MPSAQFIASVTANVTFWLDHEGLADPAAWPALDHERENLFKAVEFGLRQPETWPVAADLALKCYTYVFERGYWSEWVPVLVQAVAAYANENSEVKARLLYQLGNFYRKSRRLDDSQAAHEQVEALGVVLDDRVLVAKAHLGLGRVCLRRRQYNEAERYARLALAVFESQDTLLKMAGYAHDLLGIISLGRGDYEISAQAFYQACDLFRRAQVPIELGRTSVNLSEALSRLDRVAEALDLFEEAAAIFTEYDLQLERTRLYVNLGFLRYSQGDLAQAEAAFRQAYSPVVRRAGPVYLRSIIEMNLGNVLLEQGYVAKSRPYWLNAVNGFRLVDAQTRLANSLDGLAETSLAAGDRQQAIALYEEALAIVTAIPEDAFARRMEKRFRGLLEELALAPEELG